MSVEAHVTSHNRPPYRRYVRQRLGQIGVATEKLDKRIRNLSTSIHLQDMTYDDVRENLQPHIDDATAALQSVSPLDESTSPTNWFRLQGHANYAAELALGPNVFATNDMTRRAELANGTSGLAIDIVADALKLYNDPAVESDSRAHRELKGVINEYTYLAVMNYPQDGEVLALPGSLKADLFHKTDSVLYGTDDEGNHYQTFVQLKSSSNLHAVRYRDRVVTITAREFGNDPRHKDGPHMSRLLVNEYEGGERGHQYNRQRILLAGHAIKNSILQQQNIFNTVHMN